MQTYSAPRRISADDDSESKGDTRAPHAYTDPLENARDASGANEARSEAGGASECDEQLTDLPTREIKRRHENQAQYNHNAAVLAERARASAGPPPAERTRLVRTRKLSITQSDKVRRRSDEWKAGNTRHRRMSMDQAEAMRRAASRPPPIAMGDDDDDMLSGGAAAGTPGTGPAAAPSKSSFEELQKAALAAGCGDGNERHAEATGPQGTIQEAPAPQVVSLSMLSAEKREEEDQNDEDDAERATLASHEGSGDVDFAEYCLLYTSPSPRDS